VAKRIDAQSAWQMIEQNKKQSLVYLLPSIHISAWLALDIA
jgi:hypothetical protein